MEAKQLVIDSAAASGRLARGEVVRLADDGTVEVTVDEISVLQCDVLQTSERELALEVGDTVLVWHPAREGECAIVIGRLGALRRSASRSALAESPVSRDATQPPDELLIEARKALTLRVGEGSITLREDGKVLIKGKDLVSHARRMNRIRGGAVSIN